MSCLAEADELRTRSVAVPRARLLIGSYSGVNPGDCVRGNDCPSARDLEKRRGNPPIGGGQGNKSRDRNSPVGRSKSPGMEHNSV